MSVTFSLSSLQAASLRLIAKGEGGYVEARVRRALARRGLLDERWRITDAGREWIASADAAKVPS